MFLLLGYSYSLLLCSSLQLIHGSLTANERSRTTNLLSRDFFPSQLLSLISSSPFSNTTSGNAIKYYGSADLGNLVPCAGPTPPPGLTFPIETVVEKLSAIDGPTTKAVLNTDTPNSWFWVTSTYTAATTVFTTWTRQQVPQLNPYLGDSRPCCGMCTVYFSLVDVWYWPVPGANTACLDNAIIPDPGVISPPAIVSFRNDSISTVLGTDGFTYTSPSIYVAYHDISASNRCGQVGPKHTSITLSFAPGALSTLDYNSNIFAGPFGGQPKPFNLSNLPCPPQSLLDAQESAAQVGFKLPARPRYAPIIAPPPVIQNLEPAWRGCQSQFAFDPPRSLVPASALVPSPTPADQAGLQTSPAMPSPVVQDPPAQTELGQGPGAVDPSGSDHDPAKVPESVTSPDHNSPNAIIEQGNEPKPDDPENVPGSVTSPDHNSPNAIVEQGNEPKPDDPENVPGSVTSPDHNSPNAIVEQGNEPKPDNPDATVGLPVMGEPYDPEISPPPNPPHPGGNGLSQPDPNLSILKLGSQTLTALSSGGFAIADTTLQAGDPAITVQCVSISLGSSEIIAGSSTLLLPTRTENGILTAAGQTFTPLGSDSILLDGTTLSINGPATIDAGTTLSLDPSGLVVGTQTFAFPTPAPELIPSASRAFTFAGQTFTPLGSDSILLDGTTLSINGPATINAGTTLSLGPSGLVVGTQTFAFPTPAPELIPSASRVFTFAGQVFTSLENAAVAFGGMTLLPNGPAVTLSGTVLSLASSALVIGTQTLELPTPESTGINDGFVVVDGTTLTAGDAAVTISDSTLSLAVGSSGLYLSGQDSGSSTFSAPVTPGMSVSLNAAGQPAVGAVNGVGDTGSLIMLGFGPADKASTAGAAAGNGAATTPKTSANATTGVLGFTGEGSKGFNLQFMVVVVVGLAVCISQI